jgi:signal transduction histidine kinase/ligand-binding sensor domain-containing protein
MWTYSRADSGETPLRSGKPVKQGPRFRHNPASAGLLTLLAFFLSVHAFAQYGSTQWTADSGLPQSSVRGIVQAPDGYIWVATLNGVARFDGMHFTVFDKSNTPGITSNRFGEMVGGEGGDLWLASEDHNIIRYHEGRFIAVTDGIPPHSISGLSGNAHGGVWVNSDGIIFKWNAQSRRFEKEAFNRENLHFVPQFWETAGFWTIDDRTLVCFSRGTLKKYALPKTLILANLKAVAEGWDSVVWLSFLDGSFGRLINGEITPQSKPIIMPFQTPGLLDWKTKIDPNLQRTLTFPSDGSEKDIDYTVISDDNEHNSWVGSERGGLFRIQKQFIQTLTSANGLASDNVYPLMKASSGDMWIGSWPAGLTRIHNGEITTFSTKDGVPGLVSALGEDRNGTVWIGTHNGVRIFSEGRLINPPGLPKEKLPAVQVIHQAANGEMMLGSSSGIYVIAGENSRWITERDGLATNDARVIIEDRRGDLWIGGYGGVTQIHNGTFTRWTEAEGLPSNNVRSIFEDSSGDIWAGTYDGGIGWFQNGKWINFNTANGLYDNGAFQILEDGQERFWISSNRGIYRVSRKQLRDVALGRQLRAQSIAYGRADGMLNMECNGGLWPAGAKDDRGRLWFPTQRGVAIIDPRSVSTIDQPPRVVIESASIEHKAQSSVDALVLHPGQTSFEIQYTALSYIKPEQISFRYLLNGVDEGWQEVGGRRTAYFTHLPPGHYTFRVAARNSDGVASLNDAVIAVTVIPPFYRRWWFVVVVIIVSAAIVAALWVYRVQQLKKAHSSQQAFSRELIASQENERRRIAAELHDSLGQRLIIINNLALFLLRPKGKIKTEEEKQQTIQEISGEALQAIEETRAISYALRPFQLDRLGLTKAIQALVKTVSNATGIEFSTEIADIDRIFPEDLRINFYRIVQEQLNNIVKHSEASHASVVVKKGATVLVLKISDNGKGLPQEPRKASAGPGGFGMTGMRERATLLRGKMNISGEPGAGTLLVIEFPLESAPLS